MDDDDDEKTKRGRRDKNDAYLGGPASFPLGWLLAGHVCGRSAGLLVL